MKPRSLVDGGVLTRSLLVCGAYYLGTLLGYALIFPSSYISIIWPPNAVLLVTLLLSPPRQWLWLLSVAFPVHLLAQAQMSTPASSASLHYAFDCIVVPLTAVALRRFGVGDVNLDSLRRSVVFITVTAAAVALASLTWSPLIVTLRQGGGDLTAQWGLVFLSNLLPFLIATPGLMIALGRGGRTLWQGSVAQYTEFALLALGLLICGIGAFGLAARQLGEVPALFYAPLPLLLWASVRFGPGGLSCTFMVFALMAMFNAVAGYGPFVSESAQESVLRVQVFLIALYVPLLVLASVVRERSRKEDALRRSEARYRAVVEDQTELICRCLPNGMHTFVNEAYCQFFQRSREDLLGCALWDVLPSDESAACS